MEVFVSWDNFVTGEVDNRTSPPTTDEEARQYIPQVPAAQNLYTIHRETGKGVLESMIEVLTACIPKEKRL